MSADPTRNFYRRERLRLDPQHRIKVIDMNAISRGYTRERTAKKSNFTLLEVAALCGVSADSVIKYESWGVIPEHTYPSRRRVYWAHQAVLVAKLFRRMREEGWPNAAPRFQSRNWTHFLEGIHSDWNKKGDADEQGTSGGSLDY